MKIFVNFLAATNGGQKTRALAFHANITEFFPEIDFVFLKNQGTFDSFVSHNNIKVIEINFTGNKFRSIRRMIWENIFLKNYIKTSDCDIYLTFSHYLPITHIPQKCVVAVSNLAPFANQVITNETFWNSVKLRILKYTIIQSTIKADAVIALSKTCRKILIDHGISSNLITVIPNGVDAVVNHDSEFLEIESTDTTPFILCVSHFYRYKNFEILLRSFKILKDSCDCIHHLKIVGRFEDKAYVSEVRSLINKLDIQSCVKLIPEVDRSELNIFYQQAELFVFPSMIENSPNVLLEAMSHGLPIISSNQDPMPEFGGNAISYFETDDDNDLANKMECILIDHNLGQKMGLLALEQSRHFSWKKFTTDVVRLCSTLR